jgi:hypothetical protein
MNLMRRKIVEFTATVLHRETHVQHLHCIKTCTISHIKWFLGSRMDSRPNSLLNGHFNYIFFIETKFYVSVVVIAVVTVCRLLCMADGEFFIKD